MVDVHNSVHDIGTVSRNNCHIPAGIVGVTDGRFDKPNIVRRRILEAKFGAVEMVGFQTAVAL